MFNASKSRNEEPQLLRTLRRLGGAKPSFDAPQRGSLKLRRIPGNQTSLEFAECPLLASMHTGQHEHAAVTQKYTSVGRPQPTDSRTNFLLSHKSCTSSVAQTLCADQQGNRRINARVAAYHYSANRKRADRRHLPPANHCGQLSRENQPSHLQKLSHTPTRDELQYRRVRHHVFSTRHEARHSHARQTWHYKIPNLCYVFSTQQETRYATHATNFTRQNPTPDALGNHSVHYVLARNFRRVFPQNSAPRLSNLGGNCCFLLSHRKRMRWCHTLATHNNMTKLLFERGDAQRRRCPGRPTTPCTSQAKNTRRVLSTPHVLHQIRHLSGGTRERARG